MARPTRALICRTVHDDPDRRWVAHISDTLIGTGRITQRRDDGTGLREYAPTWEAALAAAEAHLDPEPRAMAACGYCHHPGTGPCAEEYGTGYACTRAEGHEPPHVACGEQHGLVMWQETVVDPLPAAQRFAEQLGRALRPDVPHEPLTFEEAEELAGQLEKVEQERDHLATVLATTARQRDEADKPLTQDAIESVLHDILPLTTEHLKADDIANIASDLYLALTEEQP